MAEELKIIMTVDDQATGKVSGLNKALGGLGTLASGALKVGLGVAVGGVAALGAGLVTSTLAAMDAENVQADLVATLLSTKGVSGMTADALNALATGFQNTTRFEDDTTLKGEAMLLTFTNIGKNVFPQATEAMLNMGQKFGSLDAAALQLGKALNDPIAGVGALRRVGVQLTDAQELQIKSLMALGDVQGAQKIILGELQTEFGGLAVAAGQTFAGKLDILKNKFGDIQEKIGGAMLPALTKLGEKLIEVLNNPAVVAAIETITNWLGKELPKAIDTGMALLSTLQKDGITGVLTQAQAWAAGPEVQKALVDVGALISRDITQGIRDYFSSKDASASVTGSISIMLRDVGTALIPVLRESGLSIAQGIVQGMLEGITGKKMAGEMSAGLRGALDQLRGIAMQPMNIMNWIIVGEEISGAILNGLSGGALKNVHVLTDTWRKMFNDLMPGMKLGDKLIPVQTRQFGGSARAGVPYVVGERRPELFVPDQSGNILPGVPALGGGGLTFVYAPTFSLADAREFETKLRPMLDQWYQGARRRRV